MSQPFCSKHSLITICLLAIVFGSMAYAGQILQPRQASPLESKRHRTPLLTHSDMLAVGRIPNIQSSAQQIDRLLQTLRPNWPTRGWTAVSIIGEYIRNEQLDNIEAAGWLEFIYFNPKVTGGSGLVLAFPVNEPSAYIRLISSQPTITQQTLQSGISHLREQHATTTDIYLAPVTRKIMLFSTSRKAIELARALYLREEQGLLPDSTGVLSLHIQPKRIFNTHNIEISQALQQLRNDISIDIAKRYSYLKGPTQRLLQSFLNTINSLASQVVLAEMNVSFNNEQLVIKTESHFSDDSIATYMRSMNNQSQDDLLKYITDRFTTFSWGVHTPEAINILASGFGQIASNALEGAVNSDARNNLLKCFNSFIDLQPTASLSGTLANEHLAPAQVTIVKINNDKNMPNFIKHLKTLLNPGQGLVDSLERSGIAAILTHTPKVWVDSKENVEIDRLELALRISGITDNDALSPPLSHRFTTYLCTHNKHLILLNSAQPKKDMAYILNLTSRAQNFNNKFFQKNVLPLLPANQFTSIRGIYPVKYLKAVSKQRLTMDSSSLNQTQRFHDLFSGHLNAPFPMLSSSYLTFSGELKRPIYHTRSTIPVISLKRMVDCLLNTTSSATSY